MKVKDFATVVSGATPSSSNPEYYDGEIVWFTPKDLSEQRSKYVSKGERTITKKGFESCSTKMLSKGSVLMSSRAPIGLLAIARVDCCTNQGFKSFELNEQLCKPEYLYYYLKYHIREIEALGSGTTFKEVSKDSLEEYEVDLPCIEVQAEISQILSELDEKIETNNAICAELEALAKRLYNYWFVQFDFPDENGKPYKSSGGKMVWSDELKREIPEGWVVSSLEPLIEVIRGITYKPEEVSASPLPGYMPLVKSNNLQNEHLVLDDLVYIPVEKVSHDQRLGKGSLFVTMSSGSADHVGKVAAITYDTPFCYGAFCSKIAITPMYRCFVTQYFLSDYFKKKIKQIVIGTSIKNINTEHLTENLVTLPPSNVLLEFEKTVGAFFDAEGNLQQENQALTSLRDWLLPMLMNGQVKVN